MRQTWIGTMCVGAVRLLSVMLAAGFAHAADQLVSIPTGWKACPYFFSGTSTRTAVVLYPSTVDPFASSSRLLLIGAATEISVDLPGKVYWTSVSPVGDLLLAHHENSAGASVSLVSLSDGAVQWTKNDSRIYAFSSTGEVLYAVKRSEGGVGAGRSVEVFSLSGASLRRVSFETDILDALVLGDGSSVIFIAGRTIARTRVVEPREREWGITIPETDQLPMELRLIDANRFVVKQESARFRIISTSGQIQFDFDAATRSAVDPGRTPAAYARFRPISTPVTNKALLFNGTSDALLLNTATGTLTSKPLDVAAPQGFALMDWVEANRLVLFSPTQLRIRTIAP